jgi:hypothetical protein
VQIPLSDLECTNELQNAATTTPSAPGGNNFFSCYRQRRREGRGESDTSDLDVGVSARNLFVLTARVCRSFD